MSEHPDHFKHLDLKFMHYSRTIEQFLENNSSKSDKLRLLAWLRKLSALVENQIWKKNRNFYAEVLMLMLSNNEISFPFNRNPSEQPLPKLSPYEIPFNIRIQLEQYTHKKKSKSKKNQVGSSYKQNKQNIDMENIPHKKFQLYQQSLQKQSLEKRQTNRVGRKSQEADWKYSGKKCIDAPAVEDQAKERLGSIVSIMKQTLYFLSKHHRALENEPNYLQILKDIVEFGEMSGENFRELQFSMIE